MAMEKGIDNQATTTCHAHTCAHHECHHEHSHHNGHAHHHNGHAHHHAPSFPLSLAGEGEKVRIVHFRRSHKLQERLISMGIHIEDEIIVVQRQFGGAVLIEKTGNRYAMGGGMAHKIDVVRC